MNQPFESGETLGVGKTGKEEKEREKSGELAGEEPHCSTSHHHHYIFSSELNGGIELQIIC